MTDYSDLVKRLRGKKLNCTCAAKSASECCCNTDWPESSCNEAADAIELLQRELKCANELWEQQKELALEYLANIELSDENKRIAEIEAIAERNFNGWNNAVDGRMFAQRRIAELEAALKPFAEVAERYAYRLPYSGMPAVAEDDVVMFELMYFHQARKVLEECGE